MDKQEALAMLEFWTREAVQAYRIAKYPEDGEWISNIEDRCAYWAERARELGAGPNDVRKINAIARSGSVI